MLGELLGDKKQLLAFVAALEQPPQRGRRVLEAILHVDFGLNLSCLHPVGERADRLGRAAGNLGSLPSVRAGRPG